MRVYASLCMNVGLCYVYMYATLIYLAVYPSIYLAIYIHGDFIFVTNP